MLQILTEKEIQFLKELNDNQIQFMIVGMMAAVLQDVPMVTQDIDLWFQNTEDLRIAEIAKKLGGVFLPVNTLFLMPPLLKGDDFENFDIIFGIAGLDSFEKEYQNAIDVEIAGIPVKALPLDRIIASKLAANREKDKAVMPILQTVLMSKKESEKN